jgi:heavy metal translocating P-type ATPase
MNIVHDLPRRLRLRAASPFDHRLTPAFACDLKDGVAGVNAVRANPAARSLIVTHDGTAAVRAAVLARIAETPPKEHPRRLAVSDLDRERRNTLLTAAVLAGTRVLPPALGHLLALGMVGPVIGRGILALLTRGLCVEALDAVALSIALARREYGAALATLTLLHLGEYLEAQTNEASADLLKRLIVRPPGHAWRETADGSLDEVAASALRVDDIVVVGPGEMIPVDGQVVSGAATVSEASLTGEGVPVNREAGGRVLSGSVVEDGRLRIRAVRVGAATTAARIEQFIEASLDQKPDIQTSAERLADHRVLYTLGLGALTFAATRDLSRLASVFLVDYSCALKLGAPVAIRAALARAGRAGLLVKGGRAIEALAGVDTVVFDKTGTLTHGDLELTDIHALGPEGEEPDDDRLLAVLASVEEHAAHPVAEAVVSAARREGLKHVHHDHVDFIVAHGLISQVEGRRIAVGSRHFLEDHEGVSFAAHGALVADLEARGRILLFAAIDGVAAGILGLRDHARPEAADVLRRLRALGIGTLAVLSGDSEAKVGALARDLGLDLVFADRRPEDKAEVVRALQAEGRRVAFVGDGVNDAPALLLAEVGIALPRGADLARATADVVLLRDDLDGVVQARRVAQDAIGLIRSNFRIAAVLNTVLFVGAVSGRLSPVATTVLHNGVTVGTLARALVGGRRAIGR